MTPEQKLDRLERIAKLFVSAGLRARRNLRDLDEKMGILVDAQIQSEDRVTKLEDKMNIMIEAQIRNEERFARSDERFAKFETQTDQTLKALMELVRELRNGNS